MRRSPATCLAHAAVIAVVILPLGVRTTPSALAQRCEADEVAQLVPSGGGELFFGRSISISGDRVVAGTFRDRAFVFRQEAERYVEEAMLVPPDGGILDTFSTAVAISGDWIAIGSPQHDHLAYDAGAVYLYRRDGGGPWTFHSELFAPDGSETHFFGCSVSMQGDDLLVGAYGHDALGPTAGAAYVFTRAGDEWPCRATLLASDGSEGDQFGCSVSLFGDAAIIGAWRDSDRFDAAGSAYIFRRNAGGLWAQEAKLIAANGAATDWFGSQVAIAGNLAIVAAPRGYYSISHIGSAYVFLRDGARWTQEAELIASDARDYDGFAAGVGITGGVAIVGATRQHNQGVQTGAAYLFQRMSDGTWLERLKMFASDGAAGDGFGAALAADGDTVAISATYRSERIGAAYVFDLDCPAGPQLHVEATCPQGGPVAIEWMNATPNHVVSLLFARVSGTVRIPNGLPCAGVPLGLGPNRLQVVYRGPSGANGSRRITAAAGPQACGASVQLLDAATCLPGNVVVIR